MPGYRRARQPLRAARRIIKRFAAVFLTALAFGFGGGLGGLGTGTHKVGKPERDNPIVCIAAQVDENT